MTSLDGLAGLAVPPVLGSWSGWMPLRMAGQNRRICAAPGLYRIRRVGDDRALAYIGQTGRLLRERLAQLRGVYRDEMPYRDPHTAAPTLWALRDRDQCDFEASVVEVHATVPDRKTLEAVAITLYRLERGRSPMANFGWIPAGYRMSTGNNAHLVATGRRARGGRNPQARAVSDSAPVAGRPGERDPRSTDWMNWGWSPWTPARSACRLATGPGLYRICSARDAGLIYVGQGQIPLRLRHHMAKARMPGHRQAAYFSSDLEASWVELPGMTKFNLLEHENDLIAAYVLATGHAPAAQFLDSRQRSTNRSLPMSRSRSPCDLWTVFLPTAEGSYPEQCATAPRTPPRQARAGPQQG